MAELYKISVSENTNKYKISVNEPILNTSTSSNFELFQSGDNISSGTVVYIKENKVYKFDVNDESLYGFHIGVAITSAITNTSIKVQFNGIVHIPGFGLLPDTLYYIGLNSRPSTNINGIKLLTPLGVSISEDKIFLQLPNFQIITI
jgi:hypothetical protein